MYADRLIVILSIIASAPVMAQAYRWVDKDGRVNYSQTQPPEGATNVQKKAIGGGPAASEYSTLPYATQVAARNFPVMLYTAPQCAAQCDEVRSHLAGRAIPFKEVSVTNQERVEDLKRISGRGDVPALTIGGQLHAMSTLEALARALDDAGYPRAGPRLPMEALRKLDVPKPVPEREEIKSTATKLPDDVPLEKD